ncbi:MAG: O-antigen ligase family protein [Thermoanaerobaculia bacterium]
MGLWWASLGQDLARVACVGAYITGAEVLWRMTGAHVFWEFGKYATALIFLVYLIRTGGLRPPPAIFLYFALLLPSITLTLANGTLAEARNDVSFNLSGPFVLMVSVWFFRHARLSSSQLARVFMTLIAPVVGVAAVALHSTVTASAIVFDRISNFTTSGGFGPNQVSAVLGFASLLAFLCANEIALSKGVRTLMLGAMIVLAVESTLTFSRGGLYIFAGSALVAMSYMFRDGRRRARLILIVALCFIVARYLAIPQLDVFTGGALANRFEDTRLTGRDDFARADIETWRAHPILGVGPGQGDVYREGQVGRPIAAHTEFSRLLAEHGLLGLVALLLLMGAGAQTLRRAPVEAAKATAAGMIVWSFLFMLVYGMRLVAPSFAFGLGFVTVLPNARTYFRRRPVQRGDSWRAELLAGGRDGRRDTDSGASEALRGRSR